MGEGKGERRQETGNRRRGKRDRRKETGERRQEIGKRRRAKGDGRKE